MIWHAHHGHHALLLLESTITASTVESISIQRYVPRVKVVKQILRESMGQCESAPSDRKRQTLRSELTNFPTRKSRDNGLGQAARLGDSATGATGATCTRLVRCQIPKHFKELGPALNVPKFVRLNRHHKPAPKAWSMCPLCALYVLLPNLRILHKPQYSQLSASLV